MVLETLVAVDAVVTVDGIAVDEAFITLLPGAFIRSTLEGLYNVDAIFTDATSPAITESAIC